MHLTNSLAGSLYNSINIAKYLWWQKCLSMSKSWRGHVYPSPLKLGLCIAVLVSTYRRLACEHQNVCEDNKVIIKMKQEFRIVDRLVQEASQRLPAIFQKM